MRATSMPAATRSGTRSPEAGPMVQTSFVRDRSIVAECISGPDQSDVCDTAETREGYRLSHLWRGSPHGYAQARKGGVAVAELDTKAREKLRKNQFAYVDSKGG